ncbi:MAG: potassium-transporting ATPase subunit KdpA [Scytonema sp. PMC 1069.18]|nr:potassium-transporting ATPase subunit KdpA [Scytonema sp. PMC 1069.18]MEC4887402.1 potassium-transporting ATPase subunit KdpA [Scytonema sp. PMC 1070.18]
MGQGLFQIVVTLCIAIAIVPLLGKYIARVFMGEKTLLDPIMNPLEQTIFLLAGVSKQDSMSGWQYIKALLYCNTIMGIIVYLLLSFQKQLPWNPTGLAAPKWDILLHTTISFLTNTDQQHYPGGEITFSYFSQTAALAFLMFTSAATGLAVGIALIRGLTGRKLGNFYFDMTRSITRILLPISIVGAIALLSLGVPQTLAGPLEVTTIEGVPQYISRGPVASFEMIKQLGENGGGFFRVNSAHPFENPNGASNLLEIIAMISIPSALIYTYGIFMKSTKQAWLLFWMVFGIYVLLIFVTATGEYQGNSIVNQALGIIQPNLEGKEVRFGWAQTALWAITTTGTMTGAVNGMHDSFMPSGIFSTMLNMFSHIVWGGQGTGTAYLFIFLILTMFLSGLMVGRTPEFLGRKIEKREIVLASIILLVHPIAVLIPSAITLTFPTTLAFQIPPAGYTGSPEFHNISRVVYEFASASANNGSSLEGLGDSTLWWNLSTCFSLLLGRYIPIIAILLLADNMRRKPTVPETSGTLKTDTTLFTATAAGVILILGVLTFFPVLALGPIAEGFNLK